MSNCPEDENGSCNEAIYKVNKALINEAGESMSKALYQGWIDDTFDNCNLDDASNNSLQILIIVSFEY